MKKWIYVLAIYLCGLVIAAPIQDRRIDPTALSELTSALGIPQDANIVDETQKRWLRRPDQERWELAELSADQRQIVLHWATEQGFFSAWRPFYNTYDKALILGATTSRMQMRLDYLKKLWEEGVRFREVVWLTGDRPLDNRVDGLLDRCSNESQAARILWEEADLPDEMLHLSVVFIAVPMKMQGGLLKRPDTKDTIVAWLAMAPEPCRAVFISDQPFCGYQFAVINACLPDAFQFDLVGSGVKASSHPSAAAITLDSIARWIYTESL